MPKLPCLALCASLLAVTAARADLTAVGPFTGANSESFEELPDFLTNPDYFQTEGTSILDGTATITSQNQDMVIFDTSDAADFYFDYSTFAQPADGVQGLGLDSGGDALTIDFSTPVSAFGGYFGAAFGDGFSGDISFSFSDGSTESFVYSDPTGALDWEGWQSSVPLTSVTISGDYVAVDSLQTNSAADGGATIALLGAAVLGLAAFQLTRGRSAAR